jgi:hypothetical protein
VSAEERCRPLLDDAGEVIAMVRGAEPLSPEGEAAMREVVAAVQRIEWTPEQTARYEAEQQRNRERLARIRGECHGETAH